jgi:hypothetical protein
LPFEQFVVGENDASRRTPRNGSACGEFATQMLDFVDDLPSVFLFGSRRFDGRHAAAMSMDNGAGRYQARALAV